jgi:drug/metabolite transporter (DMT)-like permease
MLGVGFALLSAFLFALLFFATRTALKHAPDPVAGAFVTDAVALLVSLIVAAIVGNDTGVSLARLWPFLLAGVVAPGLSQILFIRAVQAAGPARASVVMGATPLISALVAVVLLGERLRLSLLVGTLLVMAGVAALGWERRRPAHFRAVGLAFAAACVVFFATRDNLVRWGSGRGHPISPLVAASAVLLAATVTLLAYLTIERRLQLTTGVRRALVPFIPAGLAIGFGYDALTEALARARVTIVAPLNATQALWGILLAAVFLRQVEMIGRRTIAAALLIVTGAAIVGAIR